ncbi:hypothetical protein [Kaarinaea lacus]
MDYQFNKEIGRVFESLEFLSDDFDNYGFEEGGDDNWEEENHLNAAIRELDYSLGTIDFHQ